MNRNVLVAGGAGYIGSHVCWRLHDAGYTPVVLDDLSAGHAWAVKWGPLIQGDIGNPELVRQICSEFQPMALMNFAAFTDVAWSMRDPQAFQENNVCRTTRLFQTVKECGVPHVVFSSTAAVYGVPGPEGTVTEEMPLRPANPYGESKIAAEKALEGLGNSAFRFVILRYFNAAGAAPVGAGIGEAHWPETNLIPRVILSALGHEGDINLFGTSYPTPDGTAIRDYIHVCDLADAHVAALEYLMNGGPSDIFNLGTGSGYSVRQVLDAVQAHFPHKLNIQELPARPGDVPVMIANADKARQTLGWTPRYQMDEIIATAVNWHARDFYSSLVREWKNSGKDAPDPGHQV